MAQCYDLWFTRELIANRATEALPGVGHSRNSLEYEVEQAPNASPNSESDELIAASGGEELVTPNARVQGAATASAAPLSRLPWNAKLGTLLMKLGDRHAPFHGDRLAKGFDSLNFMHRLSREVRLSAVRARPYRDAFDHQKRLATPEGACDPPQLYPRATTRST